MKSFFRATIKSKDLQHDIVLELNSFEIIVTQEDGLGFADAKMVMQSFINPFGQAITKAFKRIGGLNVSFPDQQVVSKPFNRDRKTSVNFTADKRSRYMSRKDARLRAAGRKKNEGED